MSVIHRATPADADDLFVLIEEFYGVDRHEFDRARVRRGLEPLLRSDEFGQVWLIKPDVGPLAGYAVVTWSWSLESGGRDCLLDEIYVRHRGEGLGTHALREILSAAAEAGAHAMFLETEAHNARVRSFYERAGFTVEDSVWMVRALPARPAAS